MAIPAGDLVRIVPRVLAGSGQDLEFNGLFMTGNALTPTGTLLTFYGASEVADYYGSGSDEYKAAQVYFSGYNNSLTKPRSVFFYRANTTDVAGFVRGAGGLDAEDLTALKAITAGDFNATVAGATVALTGLDLSAVTSFSGVAEALNTALAGATAGATVAFDSRLKCYTLTSDTAGASGSVVVTSGTVAEAMGLLADDVVTSAGADAAVYSDILDDIAVLTQNFVTLSTVAEVTDVTQAQSIAQWVQTQFAEGAQYLYVLWTTASAVKTAGETSSIVAQIRETEPEGVTAVYGDVRYAAFVMGAAASIAWDSPNSTITFAFKAQSGLEANILSQADASGLEANGVNFMGYYATRNDNFILFQHGQMFGQFAWIDTYLNSTWLNSALQTQILAGLELSPRVPYTDAGYTLIRSWVQDVADRAITNGVIDLGVNLSQTQKNALAVEAGGDITTELYNSGYYLQIVDATASIRQERRSPACNFWYTYGGSVHRINLPSTAVV